MGIEREGTAAGEERTTEELVPQSAHDGRTARQSPQIEDREGVEKTLRESMERFRLIAEHAYDGINICKREVVPGPGGRATLKRSLIYCNDRFVEMSGYAREQLMAADDLNKLVVSHLPPEEHEENTRRLEQGQPCRGVSSWKRPDGRKNFYEWVDVPVTFQGKSCLFGIAREITAHKHVVETLRESMEMFRLIAEHAYDGINICEREILKDSAGHVKVKRSLIYCNDRFAAMSGYSREQLFSGAAGDLDALLVSCLTPEEDEANLRRLERGLTCRGVASWKRPDGQENYHEWVAVTVAVHGKNCILGIDRDVTAHSRAQEALRKAHEELAKRMQERTAQLREARRIEAIGQLVGGAAHEFNNMLFVINGQAEMVLKGLAVNDPLRSQVELILKTGEGAARLTSRLLALGQRQALQPQPLDLNETIRELEQLLQTQIQEAITVKTVLDPALKPAVADPGQMSQMFANLVFNARDAMPQGGALTIESANVCLDQAFCSQHPGVNPGPYVMLAVSDTGCGMDENVKAHLFEPFFTTKDAGKGAGLGLSTVYGIVKQSGGDVEVLSEVGKGTTFKIYLPAAKAATRRPSDISQAKALQGTETVLVVEDEEKVRALVCHALRSNGYNVISAASPHEALLACERHKDAIRLVVADVIMPEMGGTELVRVLRQVQPDIKVLLMSGYTDPRLSNQGLAKSSARFIQKPFSFGALARKVREALDSAVEAQDGPQSG